MKARKVNPPPSGLETLNSIPIRTKITCPKCRIIIGMTRIGIPKGVPVEEKYFEWAKPVNFIAGQKLVCPVCPGEIWWLRAGAIHTDRGWK
jgi:hypothetical protein